MCSFCLPSAGKILILVEKESCLVSLPFFCLAYTKLEVCPSMGCTLPKKIVACCEFVLLPLMLFLSCRHGSPKPMNYGSYLIRLQNLLLKRTLRGEHYLKLYSYRYLVNGFAVVITPQQVPYFLYFVPCATF